MSAGRVAARRSCPPWGETPADFWGILAVRSPPAGADASVARDAGGPLLASCRCVSALLVAHASGPGAGRFLARAILDPLRGGSRLVEVASQPDAAGAIVELRFSRAEQDASEVVRCALDREGVPLDVQLWLVPEAAPPSALHAATRLAALVAASTDVVRVLLLPGPCAVFEDEDGNVAVVPAGDASALGPRRSAPRW